MSDIATPLADEVQDICRNFRNTGKCRFGENCKYEHSAGDPIELPPREIKARGICFNFRDSGNCQYDTGCRFFHGTDQEAEAEADQRRQDFAEGKVAPRRRRRRGKAPEFNEDGVEICRDFQKNGSCRFGDDCQRAHEGYVPRDDDDEGDRKEGGRRRRRPKKEKSNSCNQWAEFGECEYGVDCRFKHGDDDTRDLSRPKAPCYSFRDEGSCKFGDDCRFSHEQEE